jgi:hypothetical protein
MRGLLLEKVRDAAEPLGLDRDLVMTQSLKDNITLPRPRIELEFPPETYERSGRLLGGQRLSADVLKVKKELYQITMPAAAQIFADDEFWLKEFCYRLAAALPRGFNDKAGNYVKLTSRQGEWEGQAVRRVGSAEINPIPKYGYILHINAVWRITSDELTKLITRFDWKIGGL